MRFYPTYEMAMAWQWNGSEEYNNLMTMAWKYNNYTMIMRWLWHTCSITMASPWQHVCTHAYWMTMIWSWQNYQVNMTCMMWPHHDNGITMKWPWDDHDTMAMSSLCRGHGMVLLWSCHCQFFIMLGSCHYHDMAVHWSVVITLS